jgi:hypothetical protein
MGEGGICRLILAVEPSPTDAYIGVVFVPQCPIGPEME